jgi:outer membrane protein assembly factor BamB
MTWREFDIIVGVVALGLAALALAFAIRAVWRRRRAGQRQRWVGLAFRGLAIAGLVALGVDSLVHLPPPELVNHPAPASASATVAFVTTPRYPSETNTVVGVSARDGATRWTRRLDTTIAALLDASPDIVLGQAFASGVYALRLSDGAVLWHDPLTPYVSTSLIAAAGARVYAVTAASPARASDASDAMDVVALDLRTGAEVWRAPLPATLTTRSQLRRLATGDGLVAIAGVTGEQTDANAPWGVVALDAQTGARRWFRTGEATPGVYDRTILGLFVASGMVVVAPRQGAIIGLRERDGAIVWGGPSNLTPNNPPPFFDQGAPAIIAVTLSGDTLYALEWPQRWPTNASGTPVSPPISLAAVDANSGAIRWRRTVGPSSSAWAELDAREGVLLSGNSVTPERAYGGYDPMGSELTAYDAATGETLWQDNTPRVGISWSMTPLMTPLAGDGAVYLMGVQQSPFVQDRLTCVIFCPGVLWAYAVNLHTGAPWWRARMGYGTLTHLVF